LHASVLKALDIARASNAGAPQNTTLLISTLIDQLIEDHPQALFAKDFQNPSEWVFNNAGGAMGSMFIIHASITEYLIIFGSAVGTEGHSGRHTADDYFHILQGRQTAYEAGALVREIYEPGDVHHMKRGVIKQYAMEPETWALEYARGESRPVKPGPRMGSLTSRLDPPHAAVRIRRQLVVHPRLPDHVPHRADHRPTHDPELASRQDLSDRYRMVRQARRREWHEYHADLADFRDAVNGYLHGC
jgi:hypothetical protein